MILAAAMTAFDTSFFRTPQPFVPYSMSSPARKATRSACSVRYSRR
jgi:hypothetical protein